MSASRFLEIIKRLTTSEGSEAPSRGLPAVEFDASRLTETVKADIRKSKMLLEDVDRIHFNEVYNAALRSISAGRDLSLLHHVLMRMNGMTRRRAAEIARLLS